MFYLLDVNVLIAAADPAHQHHEAFKAWYRMRNKPPLATCPITENGFLRIYGHPDYPGGPGSPHLASVPLHAIRSLPGSLFIPDDFSLVGGSEGLQIRHATSRQLTDLYLAGLASRHQGKFATFDRRLRRDWIENGDAVVEIIA